MKTFLLLYPILFVFGTIFTYASAVLISSYTTSPSWNNVISDAIMTYAPITGSVVAILIMHMYHTKGDTYFAAFSKAMVISMTIILVLGILIHKFYIETLPPLPQSYFSNHKVE